MKTATNAHVFSSPIISAKATVSGADAITIRWKLVDDYPEQILFYKVEWSLSTDFADIEGVKLTSDVSKTEITIGNLKRGLKYAFRISTAFHRGFCIPYRIEPELIVLSNVSGCRKLSSYMIDEIENDFQQNCLTPLWQTVFPSTSETQVKRKKSALRTLFLSNSKFVKHVQHRGLYLSTVVFSDQKILCTTDECLPIIPIDETTSGLTKEDMYWAVKLSLSWDSIHIYNDNRECSSSSAYFRAKFIEAVTEMQNSLTIKDIGRLHPQTLVYSENGVTFLVTVLRVRDNQISQGNYVRWTTLNKMKKKHSSATSDFLNDKVEFLIEFYKSSRMRLRRGMYLCYMQLHSSLDSINAVVAKNMPSMLPCVYIREDPHVSKEEWEWLRLLEEENCQKPTKNQLLFTKHLVKACYDILSMLKIEHSQIPVYRIYRLQVVQVDADVSVILLLPGVNEVCSAPRRSIGDADLEESKRSCISLFFPIFELIHLGVYKEDFLKRYTRLFLKIDHLYTVAQYEQRNCLSDDDIQLYHDVIEKLKDFQERLGKIWKSTRWLYNIVNEARDKGSKCTVLVEKLLKFGVTATKDGNSDNRTFKLPTIESSIKEKLSESCENVSGESVKSHTPLSDDCLSIDKRRSSTGMLTVSVKRVYAAYQSGFAKGTSVRLQITPSTTSREVVTLVVTQLAKAAAAAKIIKREDVNVHDYCLVAVIGSRERRLRDDFQLLKLQNPWTKGRLFVRRRDHVLEAIHFGNETKV